MEPQKDDPIATRLTPPGLASRVRTTWERLQRTWALRTWSDLQGLGFVRSSLEFAGLFLLSFVPFLLLLSSALGSNLPRGFTARANFSPAAAQDVTRLFARSSGAAAPLSVVGIVLIVLSADAIAARLQSWCAAVYKVTPNPVRAWGRRIWWLTGVLGFLAAQVAIGRHVGHLTVLSTGLELVALAAGLPVVPQRVCQDGVLLVQLLTHISAHGIQFATVFVLLSPARAPVLFRRSPPRP